MAKPIEVQYLRPDEVVASRDSEGIIYLPLAPLEWHGPHMPLGVDPLRAQVAALQLARRVGGVVLPTLHVGTERERSPQMLRNIGFRGDEYVVGMDFPTNTLKSLYFKEEVFALVLRNYLEMLIDDWGFPIVVIVNGHGGENHLQVIQRLKKEFEASRKAKVVFLMPMLNFPNGGWGHATLEETETLMAYFPGRVALSALPPNREPLRNLDWAIVDDPSFRGLKKEVTVGRNEDPRKADRKRGKKVFEKTIGQLEAVLRKELARK